MDLAYRSKRGRRSRRHRHDYQNYCLFCGILLPAATIINGVPARQLFCQSHNCNGVTGGVACQWARHRLDVPYCRNHLKCSVGACNSLRKRLLPKTFEFCSHHTCRSPGCAGRRDGESNHCTAHKCIRPGCNDPRHPTGRSQFCTKHTCEDAQCPNLVVYEGEPPAGDQRRFCNAHKRCNREGCARLCHMHDDGSISPFCGDHRCHFRTCGTEQVAGSQFCQAHRCTSPEVCLNGWASENTRFCEGHKCTREGCPRARYRLRAVGSTFCDMHKCWEPDCVKEVHEESGWCERHRPCVTEGCNNRRVRDGERVTEHCTQHTPPSCAWERPAKCANPVRPDGKFCAEHTCQAIECLEGKDQQVVRSYACAEHRCTAADLCGNVRASRALGAGNYLFGGDTTFCPAHACHHRGCMSEAVERTSYCRRHLCAVQDCRQEARFHGKKLCTEHAEVREDSIRTGAKRPRGVPPIAPVYGPPPPPPPYPPVMVDGSGVYGYPVPPVVPGVIPPPNSYTYSHGPGHQGGGYYF